MFVVPRQLPCPHCPFLPTCLLLWTRDIGGRTTTTWEHQRLDAKARSGIKTADCKQPGMRKRHDGRDWRGKDRERQKFKQGEEDHTEKVKRVESATQTAVTRG